MSSQNLIVITSNRVVLDENTEAAPATIEISPSSGKFVAIHAGRAARHEYPREVGFYDYGDLVIMPGLVDSHVHIDEPYHSSAEALTDFRGRTAWEGFETATKAAAAGGVTTLVGKSNLQDES